jgi:hypothetical protein
MTAEQESERNRQTRVHNCFEKAAHKAIIASRVPLQKDVTAFQTNRAEVEKAAKLQKELDSKGQTANKAQLREIMAEAILTLADEAALYAEDIEDIILAQAIKITETEILRSRDSEAGDLCEKPLNAITAVQPAAEAAGYDITAESVADAKAAIEAYEAAVETPAEAIDQRAKATDDLDKFLKANQQLLRDRFPKHPREASGVRGGV